MVILAEYVVAQAAVLIVPSLGKGSDSFRQKLKAELALVNQELSVKVKADTTKMLAQIKAAQAYAESQVINLKVNELGITKKMTEIRQKYQDLGREMKKGLFLDLKVTGMALLPQLAAGLAAANASMVQLAQSALLLPGILSGVASSIATVVAGVGGIKNAFKEYTDAQKNAASEGLKARNAALNVNNAYRDLNRTVKDAKRSLEDLNAQLRDAPLDEADAIIRVQEARAEAADKAQKSGLQQQKDTLNVIKAENELADTRLRNSRIVDDVAAANAKGVAGNEAVVDATDRLSKAMDDASTKATKLTDSLGELSPNAQNFVQTITGMSGEWKAFRNVVQDKLFEGLGAEVVKLAQNDLPLLQTGFAGIAGEINGNLKTAMGVLQTDSNKGFFERIFGNTATAQGTLDKAINPLIDAFLRLSAVGSDFLPRLADGLADVLTRFDNFIVRAEGDGSLEKWMTSGIDALKDLGNSIINIGSMLSSLNEAFTGSGGNSLLSSLEQATKKLADFMKSGEGQDKLKNFFITAREELAQWRPFLDELPGLIRNVSSAAGAWSDILLPFLTTAARLLASHPGLVNAVFSAFILWKSVAPVVQSLYKALDTTTTSLGKLKKAADDNGQTLTSYAKNKVGGVVTSFLANGGLLFAATAVATFLAGRLVQAHDAAGAAAQRQKDDLKDLVTGLDEVTGAAGRASNAVIGGKLRDGLNEATGQSYGNLTTLLTDPTAAIEAVKRGDTAGALSQIQGGAITIEDVYGADGGKFWKDKGQSLTEFGISAQDVADALNGDKKKAEKYQQWQDESRRIGPLSAGVSKEILGVIPSAAATADAPSLQNVQSMLPNNGSLRAAVAGELTNASQGITQGGAAIAQNNTQDYGRVQLIPGTGLDALGIVNAPQLSANGAGMIVSSKPADGSALAEQLRTDGVTFDPFDNGKFKVTFSPENADKYLQRYAAGGLIRGPGSGTSDSIMARLSHGEYVVNAASTSKNMGLLESINSGAMPAFKVGGPVPKAPSPVVPDIAPPSVPTPKQAPYVAPSEAESRPNAFSRFFESANNVMWNITDGVGDFFKGATGLGVPDGYKETSTATITPNKPATPNTMSALNTPFTKSTVPGAGSFPSFVEQVATNVYGGTLPKTPLYPGSDGSKAPVTPKPVTPTPVGSPATGALPTPKSTSLPVPKSPVVPTPTTGAGPISQRPVGAAPAGKTWDYGAGQWVAAPGTAGAGVPHITGAVPGPVPHLTGGMPGPAAVSNALPAMLSTPVAGQAIQAEIIQGVTQEVQYGAQEAAKYGLRVSSGLRPGDSGFHGSGHAGDYSNQVQYGPPTAEMTAFANEVLAKYTPFIDELIYAGAPNNVYRGQLVPSINMPGSPYNDGQAGYHGDHVHIAWKAGALEQIMAMGGAPANVLSMTGMAGSPSNMPMANTPGGVLLPQLTFAGAGATPGGGNMLDQIKNINVQDLFNNYIKSVQDNWGNIIQNLTKNAGGIAMKFLGDFFGIDLSPIMNIANAVSGDANSAIGDLFGDSKKKKDDGLPENATVADILGSAQYQSLPASLQQMVQTQGGDQEALASLRQVLTLAQQGGAGSPAGYTVSGGAEQWRTTVRQALTQLGPKYGITNMQAWEDALVRQIQTESNGDPNIDNLNDSNGQGGSQQVFGLGQFLPSTFASHNVLKGDIHDPVASIYAMVDYVATKYGMDASGAPLQIGRGVGYASGGKISGMGNGKSDSILARVSNGEYIVKANAASKNMGLLHAINSGGRVPGYAEGGMIGPNPVVPPPPVAAPPPPPPPPSPVAPDPMGPNAGAEAGQPMAPAPDTAVNGVGDPASNNLQQLGDALNSVGSSLGGAGVGGGAEAPAGGSPTADPRSVLGAAPQNLDHNLPAVSQGIQAAGSAISQAVSTAMSAAAIAGTAGAGAAGAGAASGAASSAVSGLINAGSGAVSGAVNILSSLMVGTLSRGGSPTAGAYGTPMLPKDNQNSYAGPSVVNNWNGGVHTSNNEEFYKTQQRRELQNAAPMLPRR